MSTEYADTLHIAFLHTTAMELCVFGCYGVVNIADIWARLTELQTLKEVSCKLKTDIVCKC